MNLTALQSFWFSPFSAKLSTRFRGGFPHEKYFWASAALSALLARRHFSQLEFHTNSEGARLVDSFGFPFERVHCTFDSLKPVPEFLWAYGKMQACALQERPFIHLDLDLFLLEPLPERILSASVFGQTIECGTHHLQYYLPAIRELSGFPAIPAAYRELAQGALPFAALNCGIVGGARIDVLRSCFNESLGIMDRGENAAAWSSVAKRHTRYREAFNCAIEQVNLSLHCHRMGILPELVFQTNPQTGAAPDLPGYVHLVGEAKSDAAALRFVVQQLRVLGADILAKIESKFGPF